MAKRIQFDLLNIIFQKRYKNEGFAMKENTGIDTETYKGYVKLICDDSGRHKDIENFDGILKFLTHERYRHKFNWFYNIKFDFESIIKYLEYSDLLTLYKEKKLDYHQHTITYLDKKYFSIYDRKGNNYYYFYDLFNFLEASLNKASEKFLHDKKMSDVVDSSRLNTDLDYWKENKKIITQYCIKDAELTKRLADYFWNIVYTNMNYYPKRPFSKGKIAEEYFLSTCYIPTINNIPKQVLKFAYLSYKGGRFELLKRGYFENQISYDISSAYPAEMTKLIDFSKGTWFEVGKDKKKLPSEDCYTGFYECNIVCNESFFSPFVYKIGELNIFPNGKFKQFLTKQEIDHFRLNFENADINVVKGYEFYPDTLVYPLKSEIERLYEWKQKEQDEHIKYCVKIFMNSLYGKTIQVSGDYHRTGKLFNPIWASLITSGTRIKLYDLALQSPDSVIMFSTDSVHSTEPLKVPSVTKLGDFTKDFEGEGVYIMSDIYNVWNLETKKTKNKIRGFALAMEKDIDTDIMLLKDILAQMNEEKYTYTVNRPFHLGECLLHKKARKIEDLNIFGESTKSINVNGDKKRHWFDSFKNGKDVFRKTTSSLPLKIGVE